MDEQLTDFLRRISKYIFIGVAALLVLLLLLALLRVSVDFWLWSTVETWATVRLGFDYDATQLVTVILVSLITLLLPTLAWYFLWGKKQLWATGAVVGGQILIFLLVSTVGSGVCFDRNTGAPLCWYADIPSKGRVFSRTKGFDPVTGEEYKQYTREVARGSSPSVIASTTPNSNAQRTTETTVENSKTITVRANERWQNTGVSVQKGQRVSISANGTITWEPYLRRPDFTGVVSPDGTRPPHKEDTQFPMPEAGLGSLIMRIGGTKYAVGSASVINARESGNIEFMVNDDNVSDNSGSFTVTVRL